jgi:hypothetical protein
MKIKIIKGKGKWYEKLIGKTRTAKSVFLLPYIQGIDHRIEPTCFILRNYRTILRTVDFEDAEIIKE